MVTNHKDIKRNIYTSHFSPSKRALDVLQKGKILNEHETATDMIMRVVSALAEVENNFGTPVKEIYRLAHEFGFLLDNKYCVMSTPILTNAGRYLEKPLSACTVPPLDLVNDNISKIRRTIFEIHQGGMGTGFSLDKLTDPIVMLRILNKIAIESASSGKEDRPVGNMATLSVYHPKILEFINLKVLADKLKENWKFNIS
ncbi:MAG: Ribonucleoside-diphosphate reductase, partial [Berkelbacteria bacterium GW2011_GWA2_38_9]